MIEYSVVGLLYTRTCPLECGHCIISSSPKATGKMTPEMASELIEQTVAFSDTVCFTGGEPMLYFNEIVPLMHKAVGLGLRVTMVTGAGWVSTTKPEIAKARLRTLKDAGLNLLCVSWDIYHEEYSRPENALLLIEEAKALGMSVRVRGVMPASGAKPEIEDKLVQIDVEYQKVPLVRLGKAEALPSDQFTFAPQVTRGGCGVVLTPVIEPDGNVYACCGPSRNGSKQSPLVLGNVFEESLSQIFARSVEDPILEAIYRIGPFGLYHLIKNDPAMRELLPGRPDGYTGVCELCLDLCDTPQLVQRLRERLTHNDAQALVAAARLLQKHAMEQREVFA